MPSHGSPLGGRTSCQLTERRIRLVSLNYGTILYGLRVFRKYKQLGECNGLLRLAQVGKHLVHCTLSYGMRSQLFLCTLLGNPTENGTQGASMEAQSPQPTTSRPRRCGAIPPVAPSGLLRHPRPLRFPVQVGCAESEIRNSGLLDSLESLCFCPLLIPSPCTAPAPQAARSVPMPAMEHRPVANPRILWQFSAVSRYPASVLVQHSGYLQSNLGGI